MSTSDLDLQLLIPLYSPFVFLSFFLPLHPAQALSDLNSVKIHKRQIASPRALIDITPFIIILSPAMTNLSLMNTRIFESQDIYRHRCEDNISCEREQVT